MKAFLRELALTRIYQRSSEPPAGRQPWRRGGGGRRPCIYAASLKTATPRATGLERHAGAGSWSRRRGPRSRRRSTDTTPRCARSLRLDAKRRSLRSTMIEERVHDQLQGNVVAFVQQFAAAAGQPQDATEPTVHQALFLSNGRQVQSWLAPRAAAWSAGWPPWPTRRPLPTSCT